MWDAIIELDMELAPCRALFQDISVSLLNNGMHALIFTQWSSCTNIAVQLLPYITSLIQLLLIKVNCYLTFLRYYYYAYLLPLAMQDGEIDW